MVLLFGVVVAFTQTPFTVRVLDVKREPLRGATVVFQGNTKTSDQQGIATFTEVTGESANLDSRCAGLCILVVLKNFSLVDVSYRDPPNLQRQALYKIRPRCQRRSSGRKSG